MENRIKLYFVYIAIAVTAVLMPVTPGAAQEDGAGPKTMKDRTALSPGIEKAENYVRGIFEPLNGTVTDVDGKRVKVALDGDRRPGKGMRLSVFRTGRPFYHPVTNE
ncbi:MAG: hypothetical protein OEU95_02755, partial [Nitrospirota bacterium]|nr:hypothetical protein [Nitrospirota bacterium]